VTFKELRKIIAEKKKEMEIEAKHYDPNYYWKGKKIVSIDQWYQIKEDYGLKAAYSFFLMITVTDSPAPLMILRI
jgi:hypothetical protein